MAFSARGKRIIKGLEVYATKQRWDSFNLLSRVKITSVSDGHVEGSFEVTEDMCNMGGSLHGGFSCSIIDFICFFGLTGHPKGTMSWTTQLSVSYLNKALIGDRIRFSAKPIIVSKLRAVMECVLVNEKNGRLVTKGTLDFIIPDPPLIFMDLFPFDPTVKD